MRSLLVSTIAMLACGTAFAAHGAPAYKVAAKFTIGGEGGWDYVTVDDVRHRLYVSRGEHVQVVDTKSGKVVGDIAETPGVHGVALAQNLGVGFTSNGRGNSVTVFDLESLAVKATVKVSGANPDAILYDAGSKRLFTFNGRSSNATVIDAAKNTVIDTIALSGKPEAAVSDGKGHIYVNIEDRNSLAMIEIASSFVTREWSLGDCEEPTGLAIDRSTGRLFAGCHNREMVVIDAASGNVLDELPIGAGVDGVEFDPLLHVALASNGDGTITVVSLEPGSSHYKVVENVSTQKRARTIALEESTHRVFLPTASFADAAPSAPAGARPAMVPDSFVILVLAPR
jgi:YVTN family beta-propeller protein